MAVTKWKIDKDHSEINFKVKHLMITTVTGSFKNYGVSVETEENDFSKSKVIFTADTASVNTENEKRDQHLKGDDFFYSEKYPEIKFVSGRIEKKNDLFFEMNGDLTIRDITKPIKLEVEFCGIAKGSEGEVKAGFIVEGRINRKDFGLSFNGVNEDGTALVGNEVKIQADIQITRISRDSSEVVNVGEKENQKII